MAKTTTKKQKLTEKEKKGRRALVRRLRAETTRELTPLFLGTMAMLASSLSNQALPRLMGKLIDQQSSSSSLNSISSSSSKGSRQTTTTTTTMVDTLGPTLAMVVLGGGLASFVRTYTLRCAQDKIAVRLRKQAFASLLTRNLEWFQVGTVNEEEESADIDADDDDDTEKKIVISSGLSPGAIEAVLTEDVETVAKSRTTTLANMVRSCSSILFSTYHMVTIDPTLFAVSLGVVPLLGAAATLLRRSIKRISLQQGVLVTNVASFVEERLTHINVVQMANREADEIQMYDNLQDNSLSLSRRIALQDGMFMGFLFAASASALLMVVNVGGKSVANGKMTSGQLTSFATYSFLLGLGTSGVMRGINELSQSMVAAERYYRLLQNDDDNDDEPSGETYDSSGSSSSNNKPGEVSRSVASSSKRALAVENVDAIAFRKVSFSYQSTKTKVLDHVSFELKRGSIVALVGKNGSGKSTISGLLAGLYKPQSGQIESSDGVDLTSLDATSKKALIQIVPQNVALFNTSILENVRYAKSDATEEDVRRALGLANCDDFVNGLEGGIEFVVGRNGDKLSGGERQRLALARALLSEPVFLILDEPGSNLDAQGETAVNEALDACRKGQQSLLLITHNAKNLDHADMVLVLEKGQIVEAGQVDDLRSNPNSALMRLLPDLKNGK